MMKKEQKESFQETKKHGSTLFPFNIYPCTIPGDFPSVPLHWQKSMELVFVKKGLGKVRLGTRSMEAKGGDIFVVPPGTLHALRQHPGDSMDYENIIFDVEFLGSAAADICAQEYLIPLAAGQLLQPVRLRPDSAALSKNMSGYSDIAECLREAEVLCEKRAAGYELGVKAAMLKLLFLLVRMYPERPHTDSPYTERLKKVLGKVEQDYAKPLSVSDMAAYCGCSSSHFMRWFRQMTGSSFIAYLNDHRLAAAAEQLRQTDDKIILIAQRCGFENLSNFNRQFRARYGMTPGQYRQKT